MEKHSNKSSYLGLIDLKAAFEAADEAVNQGRALLLDFFGKNHNVQFKDKAGLVSDADKNTENLMKNILNKAFPEFEFLGEETSYSDQSQSQNMLKKSKKPRWILDPLDGTTNYLHQQPVWCISLALEVDEEIQFGIVDVPMLNQKYTAIKNQGAFCNGKKISVSGCQDLQTSLMATGFIPERPEALKQQLKIFENFIWKIHGIRSPGAAAYHLAQVASGHLDLYWENGINAWDVAAGILLVNEAGGKCLNYQGEKYDAYRSDLIAGSSELTDIFFQELKKII